MKRIALAKSNLKLREYRRGPRGSMQPAAGGSDNDQRLIGITAIESR